MRLRVADARAQPVSTGMPRLRNPTRIITGVTARASTLASGDGMPQERKRLFAGGSMGLLTQALITIGLGVLAMWAISRYLIATAAPKPSEIAWLESSAPGELYQSVWVCNALVANAELGVFAETATRALSVDDSVDLSLRLIGKLSGGVWVGGRIFLTSNRIVFVPNALNRAITDGIDSIPIRLADIRSVSSPSGLGPTNVVIRADGGELRLRCRRARDFISQLGNLRAG